MKAYVTTALGNFCIEEQDKKIIRVSYVQDEIPVEQDKLNYILKKAQQQLQEYCLGERQEFKLPLNPQGTAFQKKVWQALSEIPYGETATYKEIAEKIGQPEAYRAVGAANNKNPLLIFIPCHRVIGVTGSLIGFAAGLSLKESLLNLEKLAVAGAQVCPQQIKQQLQELAEEKYQAFSKSLVPNIDNILGVRVPILRKIAKNMLKEDWRSYLKVAPQEHFEEVMLQGMIIGYVNCSLEERLHHIKVFVPQINNWAICDNFCNGLKFAKNNKAQVWNFLQPYLASKKEFEVRFAVVMFLEYYLDEEYAAQVLAALDKIKHDGYYVKMAVAWVIATCFLKAPALTKAYLQNNLLDDFTHNKAVQKIIESCRVSLLVKNEIRAMRRN